MFMVRNSFCHDLYLKRLKLRVFFAANWPPAGRQAGYEFGYNWSLLVLL